MGLDLLSIFPYYHFNNSGEFYGVKSSPEKVRKANLQ